MKELKWLHKDIDYCMINLTENLFIESGHPPHALTAAVGDVRGELVIDRGRSYIRAISRWEADELLFKSARAKRKSDFIWMWIKLKYKRVALQIWLRAEMSINHTVCTERLHRPTSWWTSPHPMPTVKSWTASTTQSTLHHHQPSRYLAMSMMVSHLHLLKITIFDSQCSILCWGLF